MSDFPSDGAFGRRGGPILASDLQTPLGAFLASGSSTAASAAWPVSNLGIFVPWALADYITVSQFVWVNGVTVSGNMDQAIYDWSGNRLISLGSTPQSGVSGLQTAAASISLRPGYYWMAFACDNTLATFSRWSRFQQAFQGCGVQEMASAFPLPTTPTFANPNNAYVPVFGHILSGQP